MRRWSLLLFVLSCLACGHPPAASTQSSPALFPLTQPLAQTAPFPTIPDPTITPGSLCDNPDEQRYPEQINYCRRKVAKSKKQLVIVTYDQKLQYQVGSMDRGDFKIDHLVPLCMGGSNEISNLWPQHRSIYAITDKLEQSLCVALSQALMTQAEAVEKIVSLKRELELAPVIQQECDALIGTDYAEAMAGFES